MPAQTGDHMAAIDLAKTGHRCSAPILDTFQKRRIFRHGFQQIDQLFHGTPPEK